MHIINQKIKIKTLLFQRSKPVPIIIPGDAVKVLAYLANPQIRRKVCITENWLFASTGVNMFLKNNIKCSFQSVVRMAFIFWPNTVNVKRSEFIELFWSIRIQL